MLPGEVNNALAKLLPDYKPDEFPTEIRRLGALAEYKYDEYQQFAPGRYFMESFVAWLARIKDEKHRQAAYEFVRNRLVFFGRGDIYHFAQVAYQHAIRTDLVRWETEALGLPIHKRPNVARSLYFKHLKRNALFFGLSDGARIDDFRRLGELHNDQVHSTYHVTPDRLREMIKKAWVEYRNAHAKEVAAEGIGDIGAMNVKRVFLVDDLSASGTSIIDFDETKKTWGGRYTKFIDLVLGDDKTDGKDRPEYTDLDQENLEVHLVFYVATDEANSKVDNQIREYNAWRKSRGLLTARTNIITIQRLGSNLPVGKREGDEEFAPFIDAYDMTGSYDKSMAKGGPDGHQKWGFKKCALPIVLYHNCPNNSIGPIWMYPGEKGDQGLFPRVRRHWWEE